MVKKLAALTLLLMIVFAGLAAASHAPENLRIIRSAAKSVTIGWNTVPGITGYGLYVDGTRVATAGVSATQAKFGTPENRRYVLGVQALKTGGAMSTITVEPRWVTVSVNIPPEQPPPDPTYSPPASIASDGSVDVTSAMLNWLATVSDNSTVTFKAGATYRIDGTLLLNYRQNLTFEGNGATFRSYKPMVTGNWDDGQRAMWRIVQSGGIVFRNMTLRGAYTNGGTHDESLQYAHAIDLRGTSVQITNVTMTDFAGDGVHFGLNYFDNTGRSSGTLADSTILRTGRNAVSVTAANNVTVERVTTDTIGFITFDVEPDFNVGPGTGTSNIIVRSNKVGSYFLYSYAIVGNAANVDQQFVSNQATSAKGLRVAIIDPGSHGFRPQRVTINGNTSTSTTVSPVIEARNVDSLTVTNNTLPTNGFLLRCTSVTSLTFSGNTPANSEGCFAPPPPGATANLWVDTNGGSCTRASTAGGYSDAAACGSFAVAYGAAVAGDTVRVRPGSYPNQFFAGGFGASQGKGTKAVTFVGEVGNIVRQIHIASDNLTFDGINIDAGGQKTSGAGFENGGGANTTFKNGRIGNISDEKGALTDGRNTVFDNVVFHDVVLRTNGVHLECLMALWNQGMVIRNSRFENCAIMAASIGIGNWWVPLPPPYDSVTLEGNFFGTSRTDNGACCAVYSLALWSTDARNEAQNNFGVLHNWVIRNNHIEPGSSVIVRPTDDGTNIICGNTGNAPANWKNAC